MIHKGHVAGVRDQRRSFALWPPPSAGGFRPAASVPDPFPLFERVCSVAAAFGGRFSAGGVGASHLFRSFERLQHSRRVKAGRSADKHDHLFEFSRRKLGNDFIDGALMQQKDSRDYVLANAFSGGPAHRIRMKLNTERFDIAQEDTPATDRTHGAAGRVATANSPRTHGKVLN